ncbi:MAG: hypothetical protein M1549_02875 [Candidatus Dependentiae bacterium]|nr:hypothetical protein [Candidatus Dependentiae bacterium]
MIGSINALLLVQMFHFLVAYLILKHLFLKPGLAVMQARDGIDQALKRDLALMHEEVQRQEGIAQDQWERHCRVLSSRVPVSQREAVARPVHQFPPLEPVSQQEEQQLTDQLARTIMRHVMQEK